MYNLNKPCISPVGRRRNAQHASKPGSVIRLTLFLLALLFGLTETRAQILTTTSGEPDLGPT